MKFKMQKEQTHSRLVRVRLRHQTLIALALIYLETWKIYCLLSHKKEAEINFHRKATPLERVVRSPFY